MESRFIINRRPLDLGLVAFFVLSILYGLLDSLPEGLGVPVTPDSPWPPLRGLYDWAVAQEPAHLNPPTSLLVNGLFDGFIQSPILVFVIYGLLRARDWVRPLSLWARRASLRPKRSTRVVSTFIEAAPTVNSMKSKYLLLGDPR